MTTPILNLDWQKQAVCVDADPNLFHASESDPDAVMDAKRVCRTCPVIDACLTHAMTFYEKGIWGATTTSERRLLRRRKPEPAAHRKACERCGGQVVGRGRTRYCSKECAHPTRICETCGIEVNGHGRFKYCSKACSERRICAGCGVQFMARGAFRPSRCSDCRRVSRKEAAA